MHNSENINPPPLTMAPQGPAVSTVTETRATTSGIETPLLPDDDEDIIDGVVDYHGRSVNRCKSGGWRSAYFIIGVEVAERFAYCGISANLISYLTGPLGQSTATATAAENVNTWEGTASLLPLLGAFMADSYLGQYQTIIISSVIYILGLGFLTLSAVLQSSSFSHCGTTNDGTPCSPPHIQVILFFFSLYLVAIGQGGHKPCVQAFGADQFDADNPKECKAKSSFFNWWYSALCAGVMASMLIITYIQDNLNWGLGFGIPCIVMSIALVIFLLGTMTYRFSNKRDGKSAFVRIGQVFLEAAKNWRAVASDILEEEGPCGTLPHHSSQFKFLNKALISPNGSKGAGVVCSISEVEEAKAVIRLIPIWATCLVYGLVNAQAPTFFTKQGVTMDRSIGPSFKIPAASLQSIISLTIITLVPAYDRILVPIARMITGKPSGLTMLQRIGTGIFFSLLSMVIAALVEMKRLKTALEYGLADNPGVTIPMSIWWMTPQYLLFGIGDVFITVGMQEFFYDQMPTDMKSIGLALYLSVFGIGNFMSSFLISIIEKTTGGEGKDSWFSNNLNRAHLDYFYWLLAGLTSVAFVAYLYFTKHYIYNRGRNV